MCYCYASSLSITITTKGNIVSVYDNEGAEITLIE